MRQALALLTLALSVGCGADDAGTIGDEADASATTIDAAPGGTADARVGGGTPDASSSSPDAATNLITLKRCTGRSFTPGTKGPWNHSIVSAGIALASAQHSAADVLTTSTTNITVSAKIAYGVLFVDLEDENIRLLYDDCTGWKQATSQVSDDEGIVSYTFPSLAYGIYDLRWEVAGDVTNAPARIFVLPRNTHFAVFDIDGTLTTDDLEVFVNLWNELLEETYVPEAYDGAVDITKAFAEKAYVPLYLTGRPYWVTKVTREWLADLGFAVGPLVVAPTNGEALPSDTGVGNFKKGKLSGWKTGGYALDYAHGNATTDIYAYLGAGLSAAVVYIIGPHAGEMGTHLVTPDWLDRIVEVKKLPKVGQPFGN